MVDLKEIPDIKLKGVSQFSNKTLSDIVGNDNLDIIVWRMRCPHCKTLLNLLNQEGGKRMVAINIDENINKTIRTYTSQIGNITHYHVSKKDKETLLNFFNIETVPFVETITVDLFNSEF